MLFGFYKPKECKLIHMAPHQHPHGPCLRKTIKTKFLVPGHEQRQERVYIWFCCQLPTWVSEFQKCGPSDKGVSPILKWNLWGYGATTQSTTQSTWPCAGALHHPEFSENPRTIPPLLNIEFTWLFSSVCFIIAVTVSGITMVLNTYSWLFTQGSPGRAQREGAGDHVGCWGSNLSQPHER